ncbi:cyclase family protein [Anaerotignum lactatifermentans]|uniref:Cyclase family protein n=1 Tax=Anaerotignum lactatifermentans TaxID=160404 RepID=A0ABS2G7W6_9FIRM|nr:cyclase family protein [Anaerotignum lactatifermentans]MBM6828799.1 cyclase family protein [Anaerotignum lactatifermentans]MBM6877125.1 cyclase family protein [Anaerotignum lactatifermentans]MBM6950380.1 cyclase family protein [Anaerotignum lactatifermentans]
MKIIDLTHTISPGMPVYPGTEPPRLEEASTYEKDGFRETLLTMYSHTGTHMDAPAHIFPELTTLDQFSGAQFVGKGLVIDCTDLGEGGRIGMEYLHKAGAPVEEAEFLLFRTGWDAKWGQPEYFGDYPCITEEVAAYLTDSGKKGIGLDTIGLDPVADTDLKLHHQVLATDRFVIIENLTHLEQLGEGLFLFCALPLKYRDADGAPVRAMGILWD